MVRGRLTKVLFPQTEQQLHDFIVGHFSDRWYAFSDLYLWRCLFHISRHSSLQVVREFYGTICRSWTRNYTLKDLTARQFPKAELYLLQQSIQPKELRISNSIRFLAVEDCSEHLADKNAGGNSYHLNLIHFVSCWSTKGARSE